jgi:hypothetical protein
MRFLLVILILILGGGLAQALDHSHTAWDSLLKRYVVLINDGNASNVDYAGMLSEHMALKAYLKSLSAVNGDEYQRWSKDERLAFLINAYNAFTVELILTEYPGIQSIKNLGSLFQSPWKKRFITLLGEKRHLDNLEHELIRAPGAFQEPRIHFAVNCASAGCPMLRNEAYTAELLNRQLEDGMRRFLSDATRNRFDTVSGRLQLSKIFDWYGEDFQQGYHGFTSLKATLAQYAYLLANGLPEAHQRILTGDYQIIFLDYDWHLNDTQG